MEKFERLILGISFEQGRLKELQEKSVKKGLKGDEVFEFIYLDRRELSEKVDKLEKENKELVRVLRFYADGMNYTLDDYRGVSGEMMSRVVLYGDSTEINDISSQAGRRARNVLAKIKKEGRG